MFAAIREGVSGAVARRPCINPIHRNLAALYHSSLDDDSEVVKGNLLQWLEYESAAQRKEPVVRDFAAYVLGMFGINDSIPRLAEAIERDPSNAVKLYACMWLGRMEARQYVGLLVHQWHEASDSRMRLGIVSGFVQDDWDSVFSVVVLLAVRWLPATRFR